MMYIGYREVFVDRRVGGNGARAPPRGRQRCFLSRPLTGAPRRRRPTPLHGIVLEVPMSFRDPCLCLAHEYAVLYLAELRRQATEARLAAQCRSSAHLILVRVLRALLAALRARAARA